MEEEIWKPIKDCPNYMVSNLGNVKNIKKNRLMGKKLNVKGYYEVHLRRHNKGYYVCIHRLVAMAFVENPNPELYDCVDHINTIKIDNRPENLRWVNQKGNVNNPLTLQHMKEANAKSGILKRGKYHYKSNCTPVICLETGIIYNSIREAARDFNVTDNCIGHCVRGLNNTACGYHWKFAE